ncbi:hypothetical protein FKM82_027054 [Ascaphus truei]
MYSQLVQTICTYKGIFVNKVLVFVAVFSPDPPLFPAAPPAVASDVTSLSRLTASGENGLRRAGRKSVGEFKRPASSREGSCSK